MWIKQESHTTVPETGQNVLMAVHCFATERNEHKTNSEGFCLAAGFPLALAFKHAGNQNGCSCLASAVSPGKSQSWLWGWKRIVHYWPSRDLWWQKPPFICFIRICLAYLCKPLWTRAFGMLMLRPGSNRTWSCKSTMLERIRIALTPLSPFMLFPASAGKYTGGQSH